MNRLIISITMDVPSNQPLGTAQVAPQGIYTDGNGVRDDDAIQTNIIPADGVGFTPLQNLMRQQQLMQQHLLRNLNMPPVRNMPTPGGRPFNKYRIRINIWGFVW